jgi:hypothetical protein
VTAPAPTTDLVKTWQLHIHYYSDAAHTVYFSSIWRSTEKLLVFCPLFMGRTFDLFTFFVEKPIARKDRDDARRGAGDSESFFGSSALARRREKLIRTFTAFREEIILIIKNASH